MVVLLQAVFLAMCIESDKTTDRRQILSDVVT